MSGDDTPRTDGRSAAEIATAAYKTKKRSLRDKLRRGTITQDEHDRQRDALRLSRSLSRPQAHGMTRRMKKAEEWLDEHGIDALPDPDAYRQNRCNEDCIGAMSGLCMCRCGSRNHGVACLPRHML